TGRIDEPPADPGPARHPGAADHSAPADHLGPADHPDSLADDRGPARRAGAGVRTRAAAAQGRKAARRNGRTRRRIIAGASGVIALALGVTGYMYAFAGTSPQNLSQ